MIKNKKKLQIYIIKLLKNEIIGWRLFFTLKIKKEYEVEIKSFSFGKTQVVFPLVHPNNFSKLIGGLSQFLRMLGLCRSIF